MVRTLGAAIALTLAFFVSGCGVEGSSPTMATQSSANAMAVTPTPLNRPRLYPRFHDLPDPAFVGQARVLKLAFADSDTFIDVPDEVNVALRNHWLALENYHIAKADGGNVSQAIYEHTLAAVALSNTLESASIETAAGATRLSKEESDDVIDTQSCSLWNIGVA